ncbi:MAG: DUF559 domain-containing protein [Rhodothermales bacterium]
MTRKHRYRADLTRVGRTLRREATFPERLLWSKLRNNQLGRRFLRQRPIGNYVVDFFCPTAQLVVEVDGVSHKHQPVYDLVRHEWLEAQGLIVLRFTNDDVLHDLDRVVRVIMETIS